MATTKSNLSLKEIMDTLQGTGGSAYDMGQNRMGVEQGVTSALTQQASPAMAQNKANYMAQLAKIAEMDTKLAGVYGDPTSPLYIERASKRDAAVNMGDATGYKAAGTQADLYEAKKTELQDNIKATLAVYDELTKLTKSQEVETKRVETAAKKGTSKSTGGTGTGTGIKLTKEQVLAGFKDPNAANYWSKIKEADFRRQWSQKVISGKATPPKDGYSIKDIDVRYQAWKKANPTKVSKPKKGSIIQQIKESK
jgi:hypothetical protein